MTCRSYARVAYSLTKEKGRRYTFFEVDGMMVIYLLGGFGARCGKDVYSWSKKRHLLAAIIYMTSCMRISNRKAGKC